MGKKIFSLLFLMFHISSLCAADNSVYADDDFEINLGDLDYSNQRFDNHENDLYLMDFDLQDSPHFFNLHDPVDDDINYFLQDVKKKESIEKIIGKDGDNQGTPQQNLTVAINSWKNMTPEQFKRKVDVIKDFATSESYDHMPEFQNACKSIIEFIMQFITMTPSSLQALYFVEDNASSWQKWVDTIHMYL